MSQSWNKNTSVWKTEKKVLISLTNLKQSNSDENKKVSLLLAKDTDKIIEAQQGSYYFFVCLHDDVNPGADTFIHQLWNQHRSEQITRHAKYDFMFLLRAWLTTFRPSKKIKSKLTFKYWQTTIKTCFPICPRMYRKTSSEWAGAWKPMVRVMLTR